MELLPLVLLLGAFLVGLALIPFGLPGLWLMVLAIVGYAVWTDFARVGAVTIGFAVALALLGEVTDAWLGFKFAKRYGGSTRAGWGAIAGGLIGAVVGTPVPVIGNVIGAFVGAFAGAAALEYTRASQMRSSLSAGWGAVLGRAAAAATKIALGLTIAVLATFSALQ